MDNFLMEMLVWKLSKRTYKAIKLILYEKECNQNELTAIGNTMLFWESGEKLLFLKMLESFFLLDRNSLVCESLVKA